MNAIKLMLEALKKVKVVYGIDSGLLKDAIAAGEAEVAREPYAWKVSYLLATNPYDRIPTIHKVAPLEVRPGTKVEPLYTREEIK